MSEQSAVQALSAIADVVNEYDSFAEGFDHEFHGDWDQDDPDAYVEYVDTLDPEFECRFRLEGDPFGVLRDLIKAARDVVYAEPDDLFDGPQYITALHSVLEGLS